MLIHWIWLSRLSKITAGQKLLLLQVFRDPEELFQLSDEALQKQGVPEKEREALQDKDLWKAEQILARCTKRGIGVLPVADSAYPQRLRNSPDAPVVLYYRGILPD